MSNFFEEVEFDDDNLASVEVAQETPKSTESEFVPHTDSLPKISDEELAIIERTNAQPKSFRDRLGESPSEENYNKLFLINQ